MNEIPKTSEEFAAFFKSVVPIDERVRIRPMFGNLASFVNGNMFMGLFGDDMFLRLSEDDRLELLKIKGTKLFEPMKGRPMKEYVVIPGSWREEASRKKTVAAWVSKSLVWSGKLPPKNKKKGSGLKKK